MEKQRYCRKQTKKKIDIDILSQDSGNENSDQIVENSKNELCSVKHSKLLSEMDKNKNDAKNEVDSDYSSIKLNVLQEL